MIDQQQDFIRTSTGGVYWPRSPRWNDVQPEDIANALAKLCRFTGHTRVFYSVAEHSVHVSRLVPQTMALEALLHDAAEAYVNDLSSPLKRGVAEYNQIEHDNHYAIRLRFGVETNGLQELDKADKRMLHLELAHLFPGPHKGWEPPPLPRELQVSTLGWSWEQARDAFASRLDQLMAGRELKR